jgi:ankyrin repeat protein
MPQTRRAAVAIIAIVASCLHPEAAVASDGRVADAAMRGDRATLRSLIKAGADVNAPGGDGMTALHWAAMHDDVSLAQELLDAGARVDSVTTIARHTPLHVVTANGNASLVQLLLDAGASVDAATATGTTPLMLAAASGDVASVTMLIDRGANPNARASAKGLTAVMFAASSNRDGVIKVLAARGADLAAATTVIDLESIDAPKRRPSGSQSPARRDARRPHGATVRRSGWAHRGRMGSSRCGRRCQPGKPGRQHDSVADRDDQRSLRSREVAPRCWCRSNNCEHGRRYALVHDD